MDQTQVQNKILSYLYEPFFTSLDGRNLNTLVDQEGGIKPSSGI
jgi:hypothetical protein